MPNNIEIGRLEDFLLEMVPAGAVAYCKTVVENATAAGFTTFEEPASSKAVVCTYLAWQNPPGRPFGTSITAHALDHESGVAPIFIQWLTRLFNDA